MEVDESERGGGRLASEVRVFVGHFKSRLLAIKCLGAGRGLGRVAIRPP